MRGSRSKQSASPSGDSRFAALLRRRAHLYILALYAALSFMFMFATNYVFESRAVRQLEEQRNLFDSAKFAGSRLVEFADGPIHKIYVPTYHESYENMSNAPLGLCSIAVFLIGLLI